VREGACGIAKTNRGRSVHDKLEPGGEELFERVRAATIESILITQRRHQALPVDHPRRLSRFSFESHPRTMTFKSGSIKQIDDGRDRSVKQRRVATEGVEHDRSGFNQDSLTMQTVKRLAQRPRLGLAVT
jgi:hypothetical protein